ncbi:MAG: phage holin family protein [Candidatus Pacebacteria bacterium]|jgi:putative membrane protein|nr:phage holin family protein [Candidatus Paceibacterota bacterium]
MKIILHWIILAAAVFVMPYFIPAISVATIVTALIVGACLMFINLIIHPIVGILTLPINLITFGLFSLLLNVLFFYFISTFVSGFTIGTLTAAFWGALVVSVINWVSDKVSS